VLTLAIAGVSGVVYVAGQERVKQEAAPDLTVEQSSIEATTTSQLEIKPLVGDDVDLEDAAVRVVFEDRPAPDAVLTDLQAATDHSTQVQVSDTQTIQTAGEYEPVNQTVASYEQNGTTDTVTLETYTWEKTVETQVRVEKWNVWNDTADGNDDEFVRRTTTEGEPTRFDGAYSKGFFIVWETSKERPGGGYKTQECVTTEDDWEACEYSLIGDAKRWHTVTETETITVEYPEKPGDGWKQVYTWEKTESHTEPSKVQFEGEVDVDDDEVEVEEEEREDEEREDDEDDVEEREVWDMDDLPDSFEPAPDQVVDYETVTTTRTTNATTTPGPGWKKVGPVTTGNQTYELDEPVPTYEQTTKAVTVGYNVTNTTREVERERTVYVASEHAPEANTNDADAGNDTDIGSKADASVGGPNAVGQALDAANDNAAFLVDEDTGPAPNSAVGAGGSAGSQSAGTWVQGESVVVQLDRPLLFEGERVTVQLVDRETNSLVMDRTVRIENTERFQFAPDGGATVTDHPAPGRNVTINGSVGAPNATVGDPPNITTDPDAGSPARDDSDDGGSDSSPDVGTGDGDGEPQTKTDLDCSFRGQTASGGIACVGDQTRGNDDSATEGYNQVCNAGDANCNERGYETNYDPTNQGDNWRAGLPDVDESRGSGGGGGGGGSSDNGQAGDGHTDTGGNGNSGATGPGV
jgi:hypothetical protein